MDKEVVFEVGNINNTIRLILKNNSDIISGQLKETCWDDVVDLVLNKVSVFISLILRHKPEVIGIKLDDNGWADVVDLINNIKAKKYGDFNLDILKEIVELDTKTRYSFNDVGTKIRANQGHSIDVDVELTEKQPPDVLYHGTADRFVGSIISMGLDKRKRKYVHLSDSITIALAVGKRHGKAVILIVDAKKMHQDGHKFYISENGVWQIKEVPSKYLDILKVAQKQVE